jgi:hypothetical protein
MDLATIEKNVGEIDVTQGFALIYDLLAAYGMPKASITRLRKGSANKSDREDEVLWKGKVYFRDLTGAEGAPDPHAVIDDAASDDRIAKQQPRFLVVRNGDRLLGIDTKTSDSLDISLDKLDLNAAFFMPWAGVEKTQLEAAHYADIKAAEQMARLYDEIRKVNDFEGDEEIHALNVFFTRLLFCFFAEDTGIFEDGQVTKAIASLTHQDGTDLHHFLGGLFETLDTPEGERGDLPSYFAGFGYVNGSLFAQRAGIPEFSAKARSIILECAELDWSEISPDIFGSMMQAVVHAGMRSEAGMHYTSIDNILKVLRPLLLDSLATDLAAAIGNRARLVRLLDRLARVRVFDPACGSGNFLVVAYRELRLLEIDALAALRDLQESTLGAGLFDLSRVELGSFFGIEVDDFACEVARLSLWIAKHQMNKRFAERFGAFPPLIPLRDSGAVLCGNAVRTTWREVCPPGSRDGSEVYLCGNPPYVGSSMQTATQKADLAGYFGDEQYSTNLDYVAPWLLKAAEYCSETGAVAGFVATNSVAQGDHVALLFPKLFARGAEIRFAHQSFLWTNNARGQAGVDCVVIGIGRPSPDAKVLVGADGKRLVSHIGPYLLASDHDTVVRRASSSAWGLPPILRGSQPTDGGYLILDAAARARLLDRYPEAEVYIRRYVGSDEHHSGRKRWCLWIEDDQAATAAAIPLIRERLEQVTTARLAGSVTARARAHEPHRFMQRPHRDTPALLIPSVTVARRDYLPVGFVGADTVISNTANAVYDAAPWLFALIQSRMHMSWLRIVGGKFRTHYRYSPVLVYNTFPVPSLDEETKARLSVAGMEVLRVREHFPDRSLGDLYDPNLTPPELLRSHRALDSIVDEIYDPHGFGADSQRVECLFEGYRAAHGTGA